MTNPTSTPNVVALRSFIPAKDFDTSVRFCGDLGFTVRPLDAALAILELGPFSCLLQKYDQPGFAENYMMQLLVNDLNGWWQRIEALNLAAKYALVCPPRAPALQPWGLTVAYLVDPTGVLWHFTQNPS